MKRISLFRPLWLGMLIVPGLMLLGVIGYFGPSAVNSVMQSVLVMSVGEHSLDSGRVVENGTAEDYTDFFCSPGGSCWSRVGPPIGFARRRPSEIIAGFHATGLTAEVVHGGPKDERDGLAPFMTLQVVRFRISTLPNEMGMVVAFEDAADLRRMQAYYLALDKSLPQFGSWVFVKNNILVQINHQVPESKARMYEAVLNSMDK